MPVSLWKCQCHCRNASVIAEMPVSLQKCQSHCRNASVIAEMPVSLQKCQCHCRNASVIAEIPVAFKKCHCHCRNASDSTCFGSLGIMTLSNRNNPICCHAAQGVKVNTAIGSLSFLLLTPWQCKSGAVFTTLYFLPNFWMSPISYSVFFCQAFTA